MKINPMQQNELPLWYEYKMFLPGVAEKKVKKFSHLTVSFFPRMTTFCSSKSFVVTSLLLTPALHSDIKSKVNY